MYVRPVDSHVEFSLKKCYELYFIKCFRHYFKQYNSEFYYKNQNTLL